MAISINSWLKSKYLYSIAIFWICLFLVVPSLFAQKKGKTDNDSQKSIKDNGNLSKQEVDVEEEEEIEEEIETQEEKGPEKLAEKKGGKPASEQLQVPEAVESGKISAVKEPAIPIEKPPSIKKELLELHFPGVNIVENEWIALKFSCVFAQHMRVSTIGIGNDYENTMEELQNQSAENKKTDVDFAVKRIRTIFSGDLFGQKVSFLLSGDLTETAFFNSGEEDSGFLLDSRVDIRPLKGIGPEPLGGLTISFGRFIPDFTYYMPRNVGLLDFVEYPLVNASFAPWYQVGLQISFIHKFVEVAAGIYNGMRFRMVEKENENESEQSDQWLANGYMAATLGEKSNLIDDNKLKDFLIKIKGKYPALGVWAEVYSYIAMPEFYQGGSHSFGYGIVYGGEAGLDHRISDRFKLKLIGGYSGRWISFPRGAICRGVECEAYTQSGFFVHLGVLFGHWIEPMLRIDWLNDRGEYLALSKTSGLKEGEKVWTLWPSIGLKFPLYGEHLQITLVDTFKYFTNPHYDNENDFFIQLILLI